MRWLFLLALLPSVFVAQVNQSEAADQLITADSKTVTGYLARINLDKADQVYEALQRAEAYFQKKAAVECKPFTRGSANCLCYLRSGCRDIF